jgi:hypothetical protein
MVYQSRRVARAKIVQMTMPNTALLEGLAPPWWSSHAALSAQLISTAGPMTDELNSSYLGRALT